MYRVATDRGYKSVFAEHWDQVKESYVYDKNSPMYEAVKFFDF